MEPATSFVVQTERLTLRHVATADAFFLCRLLNEPSWLQNIGDKGVRTPQDAEEYIRAKFVDVYRSVGFGMYLVESRERLQPMGVCGLVKREALPHPDIGFGFLQKFQGKGYAFEAASAVVEHARTLGFEELMGIAKRSNRSSIKLLGKLGFQFEGTTQIEPAGERLNLYAITGKR
ncbi:MAG TPA: GNAT family N-acetyltransferase [Gammaproteobacteria bacterium]|nr:GNAT family N-acetyltransferase [Gammaproteobacteria bacterium]